MKELRTFMKHKGSSAAANINIISDSEQKEDDFINKKYYAGGSSK